MKQAGFFFATALLLFFFLLEFQLNFLLLFDFLKLFTSFAFEAFLAEHILLCLIKDILPVQDGMRELIFEVLVAQVLTDSRSQ